MLKTFGQFLHTIAFEIWKSSLRTTIGRVVMTHWESKVILSYLGESCCWPEPGTSARPSYRNLRWGPLQKITVEVTRTDWRGKTRDYWPTGLSIVTKRVNNPILTEYYFCRDFRFNDRIGIQRIPFDFVTKFCLYCHTWGTSSVGTCVANALLCSAIGKRIKSMKDCQNTTPTHHRWINCSTVPTLSSPNAYATVRHFTASLSTT